MINYKVSHTDSILEGEIRINGSKSIDQRLQIIKHLYLPEITLQNRSSSNDAKILRETLALIKQYKGIGCELNIYDAGTPARFLVPLLSFTPGKWVLKASERMSQRPISDLVDALKEIGASIKYLDTQNNLPLQITGLEFEKKNNISIRLDSSKSSQFASAILLIAPYISEQCSLVISNKLASPSYFQMTIELMQSFGFLVQFKKGNQYLISGRIKDQKSYTIEPDWSSISYWLAAIVLSKDSNISFSNLHINSVQGDSILLNTLFENSCINYQFKDDQLFVQKFQNSQKEFNFNFQSCPDLAPTLIVLCASSEIPMRFRGIELLEHKESDRWSALQIELKKFGIYFIKEKNYWEIKGQFSWPSKAVRISTYNDHRIAMAFAILGLKNEIIIENIGVTKKSYPEFWDDLRKFKFVLEAIA